MFKSKLKKVAAALALSVGAVSAAQAGIAMTSGNFSFLIDNFDVGNVGYPATPTGTICNSAASCDAVSPGAPSAGLFDTVGIFSVAKITDPTGTTYNEGDGGKYYTGIFGGLTDILVESASLVGNITVATLSSGGYFRLYENLSAYNPALRPTGAGVDLITGIYPGITSGTLLLEGVFVNGAVLAGNTEASYFTSYNSGTFAGAGQGFLDITGGSLKDIYATKSLKDANGGMRDLFIDVTFNDTNAQASTLGWTVSSAGSVRGNAVPEPGSIGLLALGLLGLGAAVRRRNQKSA